MKIAAAGYPIDWHNRWNDYVGKLRVWVRTAAEQGAELLVFPEYGAMELASLAEEDNARDPQRAIDAVTARIKDVDELHGSLAREFRLHVCAASAPLRLADPGPVNRVRLFAPDGSHAHQDKLVLAGYERDWGIVPGQSARVFETSLGRLGILIGDDAGRPALAAAMADAGADVLLVPSCADSAHAYWRIRLAAMARALETGCAVVHAALVGDADWLPAAKLGHGAAAIYAPPAPGFPDDGVVGLGKGDAPGWVHGEVSLDALRELRAVSATAAPETAPVPPVETVSLGADESED
jgi:predicted amidohydrolase